MLVDHREGYPAAQDGRPRDVGAGPRPGSDQLWPAANGDRSARARLLSHAHPLGDHADRPRADELSEARSRLSPPAYPQGSVSPVPSRLVEARHAGVLPISLPINPASARPGWRQDSQDQDSPDQGPE